MNQLTDIGTVSGMSMKVLSSYLIKDSKRIDTNPTMYDNSSTDATQLYFIAMIPNTETQNGYRTQISSKKKFVARKKLNFSLPHNRMRQYPRAGGTMRNTYM